ncbi:MAG: WS/DGAT domain-containing protein, partial [Pseudomonadota bacterium]
AKNSFALLAKTHHAAIDGASGVHFFELMHDLQPEPTHFPPPDKPWQPEPDPSPAELLFRTGLNNLSQPMRLAEVWSKQVSQGLRPMPNLNNDNMRARNVPRTRFNGKVTPHRIIGSVDFALDDVRNIRKMVEGATVNDAVLAICGGALRHYLEAKNELDEQPMLAMAPVNTRTAATPTSEAGNQVSALFVQIGTDIEDPRERLEAIHEETSASKIMHDAIGASAMTQYGEFVPAYTAAMASRLMTDTAASAPVPPFNVSITNVPGPQMPLYFCGAPMLSTIGLGPITHGMGLIFPVLSYQGRMTISFTSCREILADADFFETCIQRAFNELHSASEAWQNTQAADQE